MAHRLHVYLLRCVQSFVSCTLGVKHVGYNMVVFGVSSVVSTLLANHAERRKVSRDALVGVAAVIQLGLLVFLLVWIPDSNLVGVFVAVSALSGFCDGFWVTQCTCKSFSLLLLLFDSGTQFPGTKIYDMQRKIRKRAGMVFTPPPAQNYQEIE